MNPTSYFDPQDEAVTKESFDALPEFVRTKILGALDYSGSPLSRVLGETPAPQEEAPKAESGIEEDEIL